MKCFFQILHKNSGVRSPAIGMDRNAFAKSLSDLVPAEEWDSAYIIVLVDDVKDDKAWEFSTAPVLSVRSFINLFANQKEVIDNV